jgi:hypothetical protein
MSQATLFPGDEPLEVVGESRHQEALWEIVGGRQREPIRYQTEAVLEPEPDNPFDPNAIRVLVEGRLVGYLSREDAEDYRPGLLRLIQRCATGHVALAAQIVGGGRRADRIGFLGVFLDHDPADFGLASAIEVGGRSLRTGLSEAMRTDRRDDRYDLSWYEELSGDDTKAIEQLRSKLDAERDPLDRHYMLCELEHRLYRCRDAFASALEEFDTVCDQHHREMETIRPVLLEKFGVIPVIEMYRQASIRCQKAKDWTAAREWAERGISVYADECARPESVDDLHKRVAHATAKIEVTDAPKRKTRAATVITAPIEVLAVETLVCASCGAKFERQRTRGRKPRMCPDCRAAAAI